MSETKVKERPIPFSGPMVRAILDGRKTQTRRVLNPQPHDEFDGPPLGVGWYNPTVVSKRTGNEDAGPDTFGAWWDEWSLRCPYGAPGDRLWVRETWGQLDYVNGFESDDPSSASWAVPKHDSAGNLHHIVYRASTPDFVWDDDSDGRWRPSIHMFRWASRITLDVVKVRVERLQEITEADAIAEGVECEVYDEAMGPHSGCWWDYQSHCWSGAFDDGPRGSFRTLWDSINGKAHPWDSNPWVWVVEFKRSEA